MELVNDINKRDYKSNSATKTSTTQPIECSAYVESELLSRFCFQPSNLVAHLNHLQTCGKKALLPYFAIDERNKKVAGNIMLWILGDNRMRCVDPRTGEEREGRLDAGLFVAGNCGSGKTWLMRAILAYAKSPQIHAHFKVGSDVYPMSWKAYRATEISAEYERTGELALEWFKQTPILFIEDLGSEPQESNFYGSRINPLAQIIEYRGDNAEKCLTLITSNLKINDPIITETYGPRVASRLPLMCNYFTLVCADRRAER